MTQSQYVDYLKSREWQELRRLVFRFYGGRCALNARHTKHLETHHRTYERLGRERVDDIIVLCRDCHQRYHDLLPDPAQLTFQFDDFAEAA